MATTRPLRIAFIHPDLGIGAYALQSRSFAHMLVKEERSGWSSMERSDCRTSAIKYTSSPPFMIARGASRKREMVRRLALTYLKVEIVQARST